MTGYVIRRVFSVIPVLAVVALIVFALIRIAPGDPAAIIAGHEATMEAVSYTHLTLPTNREV